MPLFHFHTFLSLSIVLVCLFGLELVNQLKLTFDLIRREGIAGLRSLIIGKTRWGELFSDTRIRKHVALLLVSSVVPATFFVWLITDQFHVRSVLEWHPGWVQHDDDFAAPFFQFWLMNFGIWVALVVALIGLSCWVAWHSGWRGCSTVAGDVGFL